MTRRPICPAVVPEPRRAPFVGIALLVVIAGSSLTALVAVSMLVIDAISILVAS
jgi:hypothetical protein